MFETNCKDVDGYNVEVEVDCSSYVICHKSSAYTNTRS
jgi:hypothetical protein